MRPEQRTISHRNLYDHKTERTKQKSFPRGGFYLAKLKYLKQIILEKEQLFVQHLISKADIKQKFTF